MFALYTRLRHCGCKFFMLDILQILWAGFSIKPRKAFKQHNKILLDIVHGKLNLNLVYAFAVPNRNNARYIITTRAYRRVEVKSISLSYSYLVRVFMRTFSMYFALFRCMRIDQDRVGETTSMYANRPRPCMRNDLDVCESTCMRNDLYAKRPTSVCTCINWYQAILQGKTVLLIMCPV